MDPLDTLGLLRDLLLMAASCAVILACLLFMADRLSRPRLEDFWRLP